MSHPDEIIDPAEAGTQLLLIGPPRIELPFVEQLDAALAAGGVAGFVLPLTALAPTADSSAIARSVRAICADRGVAFLVRADPASALELGADGVHMASAADVATCRATIGDHRILGVSCGHSRDAAMVAGEAGADYVAFGDLDQPPRPEFYELLAWWHGLFVLPCLAATATTADDCPRLARAGADFIAAAPWRQPEGAAAAVRRLNDALAAA